MLSEGNRQCNGSGDKDLFAADLRATTIGQPKKRIVTSYSYRDESGKELYQNVRFEPKDFLQRHYSDIGQAVWGLNGTRRVPYRLPELLKAVAYGCIEIFVTEGEKDADSVADLGFTGTSLKFWKPEMGTI